MQIQSKQVVFRWLLVVVAALWPLRAEAHNRSVHMDMVDWAYEIMLLVSKLDQPIGPVIAVPPPLGIVLPPPAVDAQSWNAFLQDVREAVPRLRNLPASLPAPPTTKCQEAGDGTYWTLFDDWAKGKKLGEVEHPIRVSYVTGSDCGVRYGWRPSSLFSLPSGRWRHETRNGCRRALGGEHRDLRLL